MLAEPGGARGLSMPPDSTSAVSSDVVWTSQLVRTAEKVLGISIQQVVRRRRTQAKRCDASAGRKALFERCPPVSQILAIVFEDPPRDEIRDAGKKRTALDPAIEEVAVGADMGLRCAHRAAVARGVRFGRQAGEPLIDPRGEQWRQQRGFTHVSSALLVPTGRDLSSGLSSKTTLSLLRRGCPFDGAASTVAGASTSTEASTATGASAGADTTGGSARGHAGLNDAGQLLQATERERPGNAVRDESVLVLKVFDPDVGLRAERAISHEQWKNSHLLGKGSVGSYPVQRVLQRRYVASQGSHGQRASHW